MRLARLLHGTPVWRPWLYSGLWNLPVQMAHLGGQARVLLTFDDGPTAATMDIASILECEGARAVFCLVGGRLPEDPGAPANPEAGKALAIARHLHQAGHLLAVHGLKHQRLGLQAPRLVARDLSESATRLALATGMRPLFQRPPYGHWAPWLSRSSRQVGLLPLFWSLNPFDYRARTVEGLMHTVLCLARPGDIILLHCSGPAQTITRDALPGLVRGLRQRGLEPLDPHCLVEGLHV